MLQIFSYLLLSGVFLLAFIGLVVWAIVKKDWVKFLYGMLILGSCVTTLGYTAYKTMTKANWHPGLKEILHGRTGDQIYVALFGKPSAACVQVKEYKDQIIPKLDDAIRLHFITCPEEMDRILQQNTYETRRIGTSQGDFGISPDNLIKPQLLGDTIFVFECRKNNGRNPQFIFTNLGKTEGYCIDILD